MMAAETGATDESIRALTIASWYPAFDDTTKGRFVADQVAALDASGRVREAVVSFEPMVLSGSALQRGGQAAAVASAAARGTAVPGRLFTAQGWACPAGVPVTRLSVPSGNRAGAPADHQAADRAAALTAIAGRLGSDARTVVHAHTGFPDGAAAASLAERLGAPLVITEHATFLAQQLATPGVREAYAAGAARVARVIAVSESLAAQLRSELPELGDRLIVVPNVVAMDEFVPVPLAGRRADELLYVGYRTTTKGIDTLLAAFAIVHAARPATTLRLVGRSPSEEADQGYRDLARQLGIGDAVVFEGPRMRSGVVAAMAEASVLVHASRLETFGIVAVEALASGTPVVATATGAVAETFGADPRSVGALVPVDDAEAFAAGVLDVLDRRESFDPAALRAAVEARFSREVVVERLLGVYDDVLRETTGRPAGQRDTAPSAEPPARLAAKAVPADEIRPVPERPVAPTLVVGFDAPRVAALLDAVPPVVRASLWLVSTVTEGHAAPAGLLGTTLVDDAALESQRALVAQIAGPRGSVVARALRIVRHPMLWARRRRAAAIVAGVHAAAVARAAATCPAAADGSPWLVGIDGRDYLAARQAVDAGRLRPMAGGLRSLVDRQASAPDDPTAIAMAPTGATAMPAAGTAATAAAAAPTAETDTTSQAAAAATGTDRGLA